MISSAVEMRQRTQSPIISQGVQFVLAGLQLLTTGHCLGGFNRSRFIHYYSSIHIHPKV